MAKHSNKIKAVVFDMDGVLIDTNGLYYQAFSRVLKNKYNIGIDVNEFSQQLGKKSEEVMEYYFQKYHLLGDPFKLNQEKREYYRKIFLEEIKPKSGGKVTVRKLKREFKLALASSSSKYSINAALGKYSLKSYFDVVVSGQEVRHGKPSPDVYVEAARRLKVATNNCVAIEDAANGVESAKNAGMYCIAVPDKFTISHDFSRADLVVDKLSRISVETIKNIS
ncbi:HAD family phosphatase [Patescibacteria group bacterium]|nr:HAD family phosphatase [Patescibacteria group bacterium]